MGCERFEGEKEWSGCGGGQRFVAEHLCVTMMLGRGRIKQKQG